VEGSGVNRVRVEILGTQYTLRGKESEEHMKQVAKLVDELMRQLSESHSYLDLKRIAVLTALNVADELVTLREKYEELTALLDETTRSEPS
jgi:cell division protein ZapA